MDTINHVNILQLKQKWTEAGVDYYLESDQPFTLRNLAEHMDEDVEDIYPYFSDSDDLIEFYYRLQLLKYRAMLEEIDDFESLTLSEKFSNTAYTLFDLFSEHREFVSLTFTDYILESYNKTEFQQELEQLCREFIESDPRVSASSQIVTWPLFYGFIAGEFQHLIHFWVDDTSPKYEKTLAFTDKLTSFFQELMYSKIIDKGFDLGRFLTTNGVISHRYPLLSYLIPTWLFTTNE